MTIDSGTGLLSWVGAPLGPGLPSGFQVSIQVSDGQGGQDTQTYTLLVITSAANTNPMITSSPPKSVGLGRLYLYQVVATDPNGLPLTYSLPAAPAGMTIDSTGMVRWTPTAAQLGSNAVTVRVDNNQGAAAGQSFTVQVVVQPTNAPPQITSHPPLAATLGSQYVYNLTGIDPDNTLLIWSLDTAPDGMTIDPMQGFIRWTPTAEELGSQSVTVRLTNAEGLHVTQSFVVTVRALDVPPLITSTPPTEATVSKSYTYPVQAADAEGNPLTFTLTSGPLGMTIDSITGQVQWVPSQAELGSQNVAIEVDDGQGGKATQTWTIVVSAQPPEQPPMITSTPGLTTTVQQPYTYQVIATNPENVTLQYSLPIAPAGMTIDPAGGLIQWTPTPGQLGPTEVFVAVADGLGGVATQDFTIAVKPPNSPPVIKSSPITTVTAGAAYAYDVTAVNPDGDRLTYTLTTAPTGMTIDALGRITWLPQIADIGNHSVAVSVSDGRGSTVSQQFTVAVAADTEAPQVLLTLGANPVDLGTSDLAVVTATDNVGVTALTLTLNGTPVPIDSMGRATLPDTTAGNFTLVATASDAAGNVGTDSQTLVVINPQVTNAPIVAITTPADNEQVTAPTQVIGTVQDPNLVSYTLSVAPIGSANFTTFFTGTTQVTNGVLGTFDPTMLEDNSYDLRLTATNTGGLTSVADVTVNVADNLKLGNFTLSFTDLSVPVAGIPITVTRTYNSLSANQSEDFGFGWKLDYRNADLQTSVASTGEEADGFFNPFEYGTHVYMTPPGGQRQGFTFEPDVEAGLRGSFLGMFEPKFVPDDGVMSSLTVAPADLRIDADGTVYDYNTGLAYNPADPNFGGSYLLTTTDGIAYNIDGITGQITTVADRNNNTLTFSDAGIVSSSGTSVAFERDPQGRIAAIVDPAGKSILYKYDVNGDLVSVTDRMGNTTQFVYLSTPAHYLNQVIDPLGRTGTRTDYDAQGRLTTVVDGAGNASQITYDPTDSVETVKDALGNPTTYEYDDRGNVLMQIDALGGITRRTYDANNNMLTETDPLGNTTTFTYDDRGDALTQTDALGNTTISTFQAFTWGTTAIAATRGEAAAPFTVLESVTDPLGNTGVNTYDFVGNIVGFVDPTGTKASSTVDAEGRPTSVTLSGGRTITQVFGSQSDQPVLQTDALGNQTLSTYDNLGNLISQTVFRTIGGQVQPLTTEYQYDSDNRLIATTDPLGDVTRVEYNALGQKVADIDALGRRTTYEYDELGRLIKTTYPDSTFTTIQYDADGNKIADTDQQGRVTHYVYDALNRLVTTVLPDGTQTQNVYDADGDVVATIDANGNRTDYVYDADGQRIETIEPAVFDAAQGKMVRPSIHEEYDAGGHRTAYVDADGNRTEFEYDGLGRLTLTRYPDGTTTEQQYDPTGQGFQTVNQNGVTTSYSYDLNGQLLAVAQPNPVAGGAPLVTSYTYDEGGNRLTQTDALGNTTTFSYDALSRQVEQVLPDGETQQTVYDAVGNITSVTDGRGTTTLQYDVNNRLIKKTYPDGSSVSFTYTATGLEATSTDAQGVTSYTFDAQDRLVAETQPDGQTVRYTYDAVGNRTALITPSGTTTYTFDALNRLETVTDPAGRVTSYFYDAAGNVVRTVMPDGTTEIDAYDPLNRLVSMEVTGPNGTIASYQYTFNAVGNRIVVQESGGRVVHYTYDVLNRLISEAITDPVAGNRTITYTYDAVGNRLSVTDSVAGTTTYTYDADDHLVTETTGTGQVIHYTYDASGNMLSSDGGPTDQTVYSWDFENRLVGAVVTGPSGTQVISYVYNADGIRVASVVDGQETRYLVDASQALTPVVDEYAPDGTILVAYTHGLHLISQDRGGVLSFYHADGLGNTRFLTDSQGHVTDTYTYDAFGNVLESTGSTPNVYLYGEEPFDAGTGLYYLKARYMNPTLGRFVSRDSFSGNLSNPQSLYPYTYADLDPVDKSDPTGLFSIFGLNVEAAIQNIIDNLELIEEDAVAIIFKKLVGARVWDIYGALNTPRGRFPFPHAFPEMFNDVIKKGLRYDIGVNPEEFFKAGGFRKAFGSFSGELNIEGITGAPQGDYKRRFAQLSFIRYATWHAAIVPLAAFLGDETEVATTFNVTYSLLNFVGGTNCWIFTAGAISVALFLQLTEKGASPSSG
jgi:RHS repeat-associated protein